jgi:hypothetical protein
LRSISKRNSTIWTRHFRHVRQKMPTTPRTDFFLSFEMTESTLQSMPQAR